MKTADLKKIEKVQLKMDFITKGKLAGLYRSAFKGRGIEFEEVREFQAGDEIRSIDWNVTARMGSPYVKLFREERDQTILLAIDISRSTQFSSKNHLKTEVLQEIGASLAFSAIKNQDHIGLLLFSDQIEHYLPAAKGISSVLRIIRDICAFEPKGKGTNLKQALQFLGNVQKKKCVIFFFSDFIDETPWEKEMALLGTKHDLIAFSISDPLERHMPPVGLVPFSDLETGKTALIDTSFSELNPHLEKKHADAIKRIKNGILKSRGSFVPLSTDYPWLKTLKKFLLARSYKQR